MVRAVTGCDFFFPVFIFSTPPKIDNNSNTVLFLGINMFWALLRANSNPCLAARAKITLSVAQNILIVTSAEIFDLYPALGTFRI